MSLNLPIGPLKNPALVMSRYRDEIPIPISLLADDIAAPLSRPVLSARYMN